MRPHDENQGGSRRPNLMSSSRRSSGEINILAMLDGQAGKPLSARLLGLPKAAWIGGILTLACVLGGLAWVVHAPSGGFDDRAANASLAEAPGAIGAASETVANPALRLDDAPVRRATVVDTAPADGVDRAPPPAAERDALALREGHHITPQRPASPSEAMPPVATGSRPDGQAAPTSLADGLATPVASPVVHQGTRSAIKLAAKPVTKPSTHAATRPPAKAASPARVATVPSHPRRAAGTTKPGQAPTVDLDVALISAIIEHVNQRGEVKEAPDCVTKPCAPALPKRP